MFSTRKERTVYLALAALFVFAAAVLILSDESNAAVDEGFVFSEPDTDNNVTITGYTTTTSSDKIIIPSTVTIDGVECKVTGIEEGAFKYAYTSEYKIDGTIEGYKVINKVLYSNDGKTLLAYPFGESYSKTEFTTPTTVTRIADFAFSCGGKYSNYAMTITLTGNVKEIGDYAFYKCNLYKVIFNAPSITLGDYAMCGVCYGERGSYTTKPVTYVFASASATIANIGNGLCYFDDGTYLPKPTSSYAKYADVIFVKNESLDFSELKAANEAEPEINILPKETGDTFIASGIKYKLLSDGTVDLLGFINGAPGGYSATTVDYGLTYKITKMSLTENVLEYSGFIQSLSIGKDITYISLGALKDFTNIQTFSVDNENMYYSAGKTTVKYDRFVWTLYNADQTKLYHVFEYAYYDDVATYTVPSTVTEISNNAFVNMTDIGKITIGYQVATTYSNSYSGMKFYEADGVTEIDYSKVRGATYVQDDDGKYIMQLPEKISFYFTGLSKIPVNDTVRATLKVSNCNRLVDLAKFDSGDLIIVASLNDGVVELVAGNVTGEVTVTAIITYNGETYRATYNATIVNSATIGTEFNIDGLDYIVVNANQVNVYNPNGNTIPKKVTYNEIEYAVVGVTIDGHNTQPGKYSVEEGHEYLSTDESGALFDRYQNTLYAFPRTAMKSYTVPSTVNTIKAYAFQWCEINGITIPRDVKIENCAFSFFKGNIYLEDPRITDNGTTATAFANNGYTSTYPTRTIFTYDGNLQLGSSGYTKVYLCKMPYSIGEEFKYNGMTMYYQGSGMMYLTEFATGYTSFDTREFTYGCAKYYVGIIGISDPGNYQYVTTLYIGKGVTSIYSGSLAGFTAVKTIVLEDGNEKFTCIGNVLINNSSKDVLLVGKSCTELVIPEGTTTIWDKAVLAPLSLKSISFPSTLTTLGEGNFTGLTFKDDSGKILTTVEELAGNDFVLSETDAGVMVLDDKVPKYTITWKDSDGSTILTQILKEGTVITAPADPTKAKDAQYTYTFDKWAGYAADMTASKDFEFTAQYTKTVNKYKVTVVSNNNDYGYFPGSPYEVEYGSTWKMTVYDDTLDFTYDGRTTGYGYWIHPDNIQYLYVFLGLDNGEGTVTSDVVLNASFKQVLQSYPVTVESDNTAIGTIGVWSSVTESFDYGTTYAVEGNTITFTCADPESSESFTAVVVEPVDPQIVNSLVSWSSTSGTIEGNLIITVHFESKIGTITPDAQGNVAITTTDNKMDVDSIALNSIKTAGGEFTAVLAAGSVTLDTAALGNSAAGTIAIDHVTDSDITKKVDGAVVVSVSFGDNHNFGNGKVTVRLPYTLSAGESYDDIVIGYINGDNVEKVLATYDKGTGEVVFTVDHLSDFAVLHNSFFDNGDNDGSGIGIIIAVIVVVLAAAAAGAVFVLKKKGVF